MESLDLCYLCTAIGNLSGIPVRVYSQSEQIFGHCTVRLPRDPIVLYLPQIMGVKEHLSYFATEDFHYYGIVNAGETKIVVGPTRQLPDSEQELRALAFRCDVAADDVDEFVCGMKSINLMPLGSVMQLLCTVNYMLSGEKRTLGDIALVDSAQQQRTGESVTEEELRRRHNLHTSFDIEQTLMNMVRKGDVASLETWIASAPAVQGGILAPDQLRQMKNTFIVSATLVSRAAIRGGLDVDEAFTLSDSYIQKCELMQRPDQLTSLQYHMVLDFTRRVECLRRGRSPSQLVLDVASYIQRHMSEPISVETMAKELYMSRAHLSRRFRVESGETLTDFILKEKTEEAKRLLRYSDKSLTAIGMYLGFSSQSHFSRVFRRYASLTPGDYRQKHAR